MMKGMIFSPPTVDSNKLEYGPGTIYAGVPSLDFVVGRWSYSSFLASTVLEQVMLKDLGDATTLHRSATRERERKRHKDRDRERKMCKQCM